MRKISLEQLESILKAHRIWYECESKQGQQAKLENANLRGVNFNNTLLAAAKLMGSDLRGAQFINTDLRDSNLSGADLRGANFMFADLACANLLDAKLDQGIIEASSILCTHFSVNALPWLVLRKNWMKEREHVQISEV